MRSLLAEGPWSLGKCTNDVRRLGPVACGAGALLSREAGLGGSRSPTAPAALSPFLRLSGLWEQTRLRLCLGSQVLEACLPPSVTPAPASGLLPGCFLAAPGLSPACTIKSLPSAPCVEMLRVGLFFRWDPERASNALFPRLHEMKFSFKTQAQNLCLVTHGPASSPNTDCEVLLAPGAPQGSAPTPSTHPAPPDPGVPGKPCPRLSQARGSPALAKRVGSELELSLSWSPRRLALSPALLWGPSKLQQHVRGLSSSRVYNNLIVSPLKTHVS